MASITSATSGPSNATGTWTGGVVPVVGDKVTIQHPGTNTISSTLYQLNGARSAGDTSIPVDTGSGTIVAGECIQVLHQVSTDADGYPVYDNKYYKVATGISAAGTLVIDAPGLTYAVADNVQIINRGHVVELVAAHTWGDDTSSVTAASNGIVATGALKGSRSANWSLTCRGSLCINAGGTVDLGARGDVIPDGVTGTLTLNDSASPVTGKHGFLCPALAGPTMRINGLTKTRNTTLNGAHSAGATSITVQAANNWKNGDRVVIASDTTDATRVQVVTLGAGSGLSWPISPALTNARASGIRVGNLSSNVVVTSIAAATPGFTTFSALGTSAVGEIDVADVRFSDVGCGNWVTSGAVIYGAALSVSGNRITPTNKRLKRIAVEASNAQSSNGLKSGNPSLTPWVYSDCALYSSAASNGIITHSMTYAAVDAVVYRAVSALTAAISGGTYSVAMSGYYHGSAEAVAFDATIGIEIASGTELIGGINVFSAGTGNVTHRSCTLRAATRLADYRGSGGVVPKITGYSTTVVGNAESGSITQGTGLPSQDTYFRYVSYGGVDSDNRTLSYWQTTVTDTTTRKRSTYAVKIRPLVANTAITYTFTLPAISGVAQTIRGSLRFDATYGTATPPSIALSGQGVTQSHTCAATADAWDDFSFTFTPTSTGDITATVTVQSASTSGFAWLDGVWHYPMTQSVRHFGYLWQPQAAQVADSSITVSEATALAYPVSVNHATDTITLSGNVTARQIYEACMADLVQTANQGEAKHITTSDLGASFTTTYAVDVGAFAVTGPYTDSAGLHVNIRADNLLTGSRVQLYNVTDSAELLNTVTSGAGLVYPIVAPGTAKTIRLRVAKVGYLPIEAFGVLSGGSVSFLDSQVVDAVYNAIGIDGSTVAGLTPDYPNLQIDASIAGGSIAVQDIYAWTRYANTIDDGIRLMHNSVQASDTANYTIDTSVVNARFDNNSATPLMIIGGYIRRSDGTTVIGEGSIQLDPGKAYVASDIATDVSNLALVHGLIAASPLVVTSTTRTAGALSQTIGTVGDTTTVTRV